ncbi:MAG TPA: hypothetical protein VN846_00340 [Candidatus Cybelea sp.]|nr:hypothetical protein [Candidatus Cybelea sp.]
MRVDDKVVLIGIPRDLEDPAAVSVFEHCLGKEFIVTAITNDGNAELQIEAVTGTSDDKIYVAPRFLKIVSKNVQN